MAKDPAFLFYFQDFLVGTDDMELNEVGAYIRCLCHQASKGFLSKSHMKKICESEEILKAVIVKFSEDESGNFLNSRLQSEMDKRKAYSESRRLNRSNSNKSDSHMKNISISYVPHMENENEIVNEEENKDGKDKKNPIISDESKKFAEWFCKDLKPESMNATEKDIESWAKTYDKLKKDGKTKEQIVAATKWARNDDFWAKNFQNPNKLRKKNKDEVFYIDVFLDQMKIQQIKKEEKPDPNKYVMKEKRNPVTGQ